MKIVGTSQPMHDVKGKVTGRTVYAGDMQLAKMCHMAVLFSSIPHGFVKSIDASKALDLDGVIDVVHCFNTTDKVYNRYRTVSGQEVPESESPFNQHVRFIGDRVAGVIAESPDIARKAVRLIEVEYEELPFSISPAETLTGIIDNIHDDGAVYGDFELEVGDKSLISQDVVEIETRSILSRIHHGAMETHCCVGSYDRGTEELTIWSPNQSVHGIRTVVADLFELDYHKVRVIKSTMGGSFGGKQEWIVEPVVAAATLKVGRPVKLVYNRAEAMISTICRSPMDAKVKSKFTKDGKLQSFDVDMTLDAGAYLGNSYDYASAMGNKFFRCYKYPYMHYKGRAVITNTPVSGAFRGWTSPELAIMLEHNINMAARELNIDPIELRLKNVALPGDIDIRLEQPIGEIRIKECLELGREKFDWDKKKKEVAEFNNVNDRYKRGIGVGCGGHLNGYFPRKKDFAAVDMRLAEDGTVLVNVTLHDHGCGSVTAFKMIVSEALGINIDKISVREGDTAYSPFDYGCYSSRTVYVIGRAAYECANKLKQRVIDNLAEIHKLPSGDIYFNDGEFLSNSDPSIVYAYKKAVHIIMQTLQKEVIATYQHINVTNPGVTGSHFAYVEVDTYTGMVKILDYLAVHDIGQAINHEMCVAQIQGAVIMGSGAALSEHMLVNSKGRTTCSLKDYHIINSYDAPDVKVELIEDGNTEGPYGAKSIGEACHVPVCPTIVGAVNDALNSNLCHIPINSDRIVCYMQEKSCCEEGLTSNGY